MGFAEDTILYAKHKTIKKLKKFILLI